MNKLATITIELFEDGQPVTTMDFSAISDPTRTAKMRDLCQNAAEFLDRNIYAINAGPSARP